MKLPLPTVLILVAGNVLGQTGPSLRHSGVPFTATNCAIEWAAPTNQMPKALWIYKTIPQHFPDEAISNLVAMGEFTPQDLMKMTDEERARATPKELAAAENLVGFYNEGTKRNLAISPATGNIFYSDPEVEDPRCPIEDVPDEATVQQLALKLFDQFGFPRSELARKPNSTELLAWKEMSRRGHFDKEQRKAVKDGIDSRGMMIPRRIDGVNFAGAGMNGGFTVRFASHAAITQLQLVWRNLQPYRKYQLASPAQIVEWIKEGKAVVLWCYASKLNPPAVKKLTITEVSPLYAGELGFAIPGLTPQDFTYPFADLNALADTGPTNIAIDLYCPILTDKEVTP